MLPTSSNNLVLLAGLVAQVTAVTVPVAVGKSSLNFTPNEIHASVGDVIEFRFYAKNHSVVAGEFSKACVPSATGGFFSGFFPTAADSVNSQVFRVTINDTNPLPIYCAQNVGQHCHNGMVAVINPSSSSSSGNQTLAAYKSLAQQAGNAVSPAGGPFGGVVAPNSAASGSASASSTSTSSTTAAAGSGSSGSAMMTTTTTTITPSVTASSGGGGGESSSTATATATSTSSASASASASGKPNAGGSVAAPLAGVVAAAAAVFFV